MANATASSALDMPAMQFANGNVLVALSHDIRLLLPSNVLCAASTFFAASLQSRWAHPKIISHPTTGQEVEVFFMAMVPRGGTYLLETNAEFTDPFTGKYDNKARPTCFLNCSDLNALGLQPCGDREHGAHIHKWESDLSAGDFQAMFAMLFDIPFKLRALVPRQCRNVFHLSRVYGRLANIVALSNYYGILERVRPKISELLRAAGPTLWNGIANEEGVREHFRELAIVLEDTTVYFDCVRNDLLSAIKTDNIELRQERIQEIADYSGAIQAEVGEMVHNSPGLAAKDIAQMEQDLRNLGLTQTTYTDKSSHFKPEKFSLRTSFANALGHRLFSRCKSKKLELRAEMAAQNIWADFITQCLDENATFLVRGQSRGYSKSRPFRSFQEAVKDIFAANDALSLFPHHATERYANLLIDFEYETSHLLQQIQQNLRTIVESARTIINKTLPREQILEPIRAPGVPKAGEIDGNQFALVYIDMGWLPWVAGEEDDPTERWCIRNRREAAQRERLRKALRGEKDALPTLPEIDPKPASKEWLMKLEELYKEKLSEEKARLKELAASKVAEKWLKAVAGRRRAA